MTPHQSTLLFVGRDDWQKDEALNSMLLHKLRASHVEMIWEDPAAKIIQLLVRVENKIGISSRRVRKINLRMVQLAFGMFNPSYFFYLYQTKHNGVLSRCEWLVRRIRGNCVPARTIILSRSSGGRVSSLIADQLGIKHIVCLGYPFKRPGHDEEPERYAHLAHLKTPMLIIQGVDDDYGGVGVEKKYALSGSVEVVYVKTNHDFNLSDSMAQELVEVIQRATGLSQQK